MRVSCCGGCVQKLERLLEDAEAGLEENSDRVGVMGEHLQNVQTELTYTQVRPNSPGARRARPPPPLERRRVTSSDLEWPRVALNGPAGLLPSAARHHPSWQAADRAVVRRMCRRAQTILCMCDLTP